MILGVHASVRSGFSPALETAASLGLRALQILPYRRHHDPTPDELSAVRTAVKERGWRLLVHTRFVPFLGSRDDRRHRHSVELLRREWRLARELGGEGLVLHAGAFAPGEDSRRGLARVGEGVLKAFEPGLESVPVLLENVPGGGRRLGGPLEELAELAAMLDRRRVPVGFCLDTAHAWAQGYDLSTAEAAWRFVALANRLLGAERVKAFHLNDSRALLGSHREHHWHWGKGYLGLEGLKALLGRPEFADAIGILETPYGADRENVAAVRALLRVRPTA